MTPLELDPRLTFDSFVVGQANRLASAAARRVAEAPAATYNPLFLYSESGLGKTHLLTAIGHMARKLHPKLNLVYDTLEHFLEEAMRSIQAGEREDFRTRMREVGLLLLDDVQFLEGRRGAQEELLRAWDAVSSGGGQVVLASDRTPQEINDLDSRLLSRFSGGLISDIGAPDYETRVAIVHRKALERGQTLAPGVAEALARVRFSNVRELQGGLNKLLAVQDLDGRQITANEVAPMFAAVTQRPGNDEFGGFLSDIAGTVSEVVAQSMADRRIADAILRWEGEAYSTRRLEAALHANATDADVDALLAEYERDVERLRAIERELRTVDPDAPEFSRGLFRHPDRVAEAEEVLAQAIERTRPLPAPPPGRSFATVNLPADAFAFRAARAVAESPGTRYNPLFVHGTEGSGKTTLLAALASELGNREDAVVAFVHGKTFAAELIRAIERNCVDSWRERYRKATVFVLDDIEELAGTERAQDELFHLFEDLLRKDAQMAFGAERIPRELTDLDDRLRTRLESGLVVSMKERSSDAPDLTAPVGTRGVSPMDAAAMEQGEPLDEWFLSREKLIWHWPNEEDWLMEALD